MGKSTSKKETTVKRELLHRVKEAIKKQNITAYRLSKDSGISYPTIHKYLNNTMEPSLTALKKIALALGIQGKDLINF
jgi:transcriptional regulator with XRE-family HTH domain